MGLGFTELGHPPFAPRLIFEMRGTSPGACMADALFALR